MRGDQWLLAGRLLAVIQGVVWLLTLSGTALRVGWVLGLLAVGAAIAARALPGRSAALVAGPAMFLALTRLLSLSRSPFPVGAVELSMVGLEVVPGLVAGLLIWVGRTRGPAIVAEATASTRTPIPLQRAVAAALALGILAIVPVAVSFNLEPPAQLIANEQFQSPPIDWTPMGLWQALALATITTGAAALVGGSAGAFAATRGAVRGGVVALVTAWATAIGVLPLAAGALGIHLRTGIVCVFGCEALLRDDQPLGGPAAYAEFLLGTAFLVWPLIALAAAVIVVWTIVRARRGSTPTEAARSPGQAMAALFAIVPITAFAVVHGAGVVLMFSSRQTGLIPYACLTVGVLLWAIWVDRSRGIRRPLIDGASSGSAEDVQEHGDELRLVGIHREVNVGGLAAAEPEVTHRPAD